MEVIMEQNSYWGLELHRRELILALSLAYALISIHFFDTLTTGLSVWFITIVATKWAYRV